MDEILGQLGGLLLGSVPTIIFIVLLFGIYTAVVHKPLVKVLAERHSRTEGAIEKARADIAQAEARTAEYEQRLAGGAHGRIQESGSAPPGWRCRRGPRPWPKRGPGRRLRSNRREQAIEQDKVAAQAGLQAESGKLAAAIIRTVLQPAGQSPAGGD